MIPESKYDVNAEQGGMTVCVADQIAILLHFDPESIVDEIDGLQILDQHLTLEM